MASRHPPAICGSRISELTRAVVAGKLTAAWRLLPLALALLPLVAVAHEKGFHKRVVVTVEGARVAAVVVMDVDDSERAELLRATADSDHDGKLSKAETESLRAKLVSLATSKLKLSFSGHEVRLPVRDSRLSLRQEKRVGEAGMSVAVMLETDLPRAPSRNMVLVLEDAAPDGSPVQVDLGQTDAGVTQVELLPGQKAELRLSGPAR